MGEKKYFGTDGIRGRVGTWPITAEFMLKLGRAAGKALAGPKGHPTVLIGKDTRVSGYMFEAALESGLVAAGADVRLLGPMPTPAVAYLTRSLRANAGIVISASHNPHYDNGIKFFSADGEKLDDRVELAIERELEEPFSTVESADIGKAMRVGDAVARYVEFCKSTAPGLYLRGLKIALDCAHGATYHIAPKLFEELGASVVAVGVQPDGLNINRECGSTKLRLLARTVIEHSADLGIAFDGDGDRMLLVDHLGREVDGDEILYILANDWHARGLLQGPVVGTLMSNYGLEQAIGALGIPFLRAKVGDRYVLQLLKEHGGILGGETSGHILCLNRASTGDGIVSALQMLDTIQRSGRSLADWTAGMRKLPQTTVNVKAVGGAKLVAHSEVQRVLKNVEVALDGLGRVVLRPSGTEPVVRVTVEAEDAALVERLVGQLSAAVQSAATEA
jgi:phosphoglucosamine mutase